MFWSSSIGVHLLVRLWAGLSTRDLMFALDVGVTAGFLRVVGSVWIPMKWWFAIWIYLVLWLLLMCLLCCYFVSCWEFAATLLLIV